MAFRPRKAELIDLAFSHLGWVDLFLVIRKGPPRMVVLFLLRY